ncbi:hypothetical protein PRUPE_6G118400 [Prunus persica]|uniref:Uncharacterized protein n=1 Tax=Prunus persica TaxID=3760 RepID=A0A251NNZ9_PRUPE|nr:hypothetical protein PRUPE_6G118400 [Prunus persica]
MYLGFYFFFSVGGISLCVQCAWDNGSSRVQTINHGVGPTQSSPSWPSLILTPVCLLALHQGLLGTHVWKY